VLLARKRVSNLRSRSQRRYVLLRAVALPPFRPAAFFCAVVPPCEELPPDPDFFFTFARFCGTFDLLYRCSRGFPARKVRNGRRVRVVAISPDAYF
jgi:hypothetical protein